MEGTVKHVRTPHSLAVSKPQPGVHGSGWDYVHFVGNGGSCYGEPQYSANASFDFPTREGSEAWAVDGRHLRLDMRLDSWYGLPMSPGESYWEIYRFAADNTVLSRTTELFLYRENGWVGKEGP